MAVIIDTHTHIGVLPPFYMTADMLLGSMERYGIDFSLVSNIEGAENDHRGDPVPKEWQTPQNELLRRTLAVARKAPQKLGVLPWLRIRQELPDDEFVRIIKENRALIYGFKLHPFHSRTAPDDARLEPVYALAAELGLPVVSHTGGCEEAMSPHLCNAAKRHPEINFIGIERYSSVLIRALDKREKLLEEGTELKNLLYLRMNAEYLSSVFGEREDIFTSCAVKSARTHMPI